MGVGSNPDWAPCGRCDCLDGVSAIPNRWEIEGVFATNRCPRRDIPSDMNTVADLYRHFKDGHLWLSGGVADQPAVYLETMQILSYWVEKLGA